VATTLAQNSSAESSYGELERAASPVLPDVPRRKAATTAS